MPGKLLIDTLAKIIIIFFSMIHRNNKERFGEVLIKVGCGSKKHSCRQNQRDLFHYLFYLYIYFTIIFLSLQKLIEELGKLLIDPLAKINIFFSMLHRNKKEMLSEVLTRLGCGSKKSSCRQNQRYLFYYLFY